MRSIDNHNAAETYAEYAKPTPKKVRDDLARQSMKKPVLGKHFEDDDDQFVIPASKEVSDWEERQQAKNADLGDNLDDEQDEIDDELEGFTINDYSNGEDEPGEDTDEVSEDDEEAPAEPDDEEVKE